MKNYKDMLEELLNDISHKLKDINNRAYLAGYNQGIKDVNINDGTFAFVYKVKEAYKKGFEDGWEQIRKIFSMDDLDRSEIFDGYYDIGRILDIYTGAEALQKIREYEEKKNVEEKGKYDWLKADIEAGLYKIIKDKNCTLEIIEQVIEAMKEEE